MANSATVNVLYIVLTPVERDDLLDHSRYKETTFEQLPPSAQKFHVYQAVTKDLAGQSVLSPVIIPSR